ncbi:HAD family hydrolase [Candidatus Woesearchaeota archaeon]|nr:HAD family hydrolase [Candidatus Woesearchaeota archaeon]
MTVVWNKVKLLLVDLDNTLCDSFHTLSKPQWTFVEKKLREKGWDDCADKMNENFGSQGFLKTLKSCGIEEYKIRYAIRQYDKADISKLELFHDAHHIMDLDIPTILITRGEPSLQKRKIKHLGIKKHFEEIVIVDTFGNKGEEFEKIRKKKGLKASEILVIGDRMEEEIAQGKRLGYPVVLVRRPGWPVKHIKLKPDISVRTLKTIARHLKR